MGMHGIHCMVTDIINVANTYYVICRPKVLKTPACTGKPVKNLSLVVFSNNYTVKIAGAQ